LSYTATATTLADGSARARVSGSWSSCVELSYRSAVIKQGIKAARKTATGPVKKRLGTWSAKKIATSRKIPTKVKNQIADRGIASVMKGAKFKTGRSTLQNLALDVVDEAFDKADDRDLVARLVERLPDRERELLRLRFDEQLTQSEIAGRIGVSQMHVSRLLSSTLDQLRRLASEPSPV